MCGIVGFTRIGHQADSGDQSLSVAKSMCDAIAHRGPDGEGYLLSDDIVFGHRRLSLLDLEGGAQPMSRSEFPCSGTYTATFDVDCALAPHAADIPSNAVSIAPDARFCRPSAYQIVFNGEIYNFRDLREELSSYGYAFTTDCDTEVLLVSYIHWGSDCLSHLRGMFAFAIYDADAHTLFCARDAFGIKPFYWTMIDDNFVFASEIKSLLKYPGFEKKLNFKALEQYLSFQYSVLDETFFEGVYKLSPGHFMTFDIDSGNLSCWRWFVPSYDIDENVNLDEMADKIHQAVQDSVSYHKIADVEVGSFLSSGVDSNYLAASLASQETDIKTFTVGFDTPDGAKYNEIDYAKDAADYLGVEHISHKIEPEEFWEQFPLIQYHMDEPLADPAAAALWFVDKEAAKHVKAVLSGEGADEFFGGYPIYQTTVENKKISWIPRSVLRGAANLLDCLHLRGANYLCRAAAPVHEWFVGNADIFSIGEREGILLPQVDENGRDAFSHVSPISIVYGTYMTSGNVDDTAKMQYVDLNHWLVGDILLKTDKMAMAHSLESRVPFLDKEVWNVAQTVPEKLRVSHKTSKIALRKAAEKIMPDDYTTKPKLGFPVPIRVWLKEQEYYDTVKRALESDTGRKFFDTDKAVRLLNDHKEGKKDNSRKIWTLYSFIVWYDQFFDDIDYEPANPANIASVATENIDIAVDETDMKMLEDEDTDSSSE